MLSKLSLEIQTWISNEMISPRRKSFRARHNCDNPVLSSKQDIGLVILECEVGYGLDERVKDGRFKTKTKLKETCWFIH